MITRQLEQRVRSGHMKTKTCPDCNGDGVINKDADDERRCPTCGGLGFVRDDDDCHEEVIKTETRGNFSLGVEMAPAK